MSLSARLKGLQAGIRSSFQFWPPSTVSGCDLTLSFSPTLSHLHLSVPVSCFRFPPLCLYQSFSPVSQYRRGCLGSRKETRLSSSSSSALSLFPHLRTQRSLYFHTLLRSPSSFSLFLSSPFLLFFFLFSLVSSGLPLSSGDPLQFSGHSGGSGEADVQHAGWRPGRLVRIPNRLSPLPHPVGWHSPACVDGHVHRSSQGTPAQRAAQVRAGLEVWIGLPVLNNVEWSLGFWQLLFLFIRWQ